MERSLIWEKAGQPFSIQSAAVTLAKWPVRFGRKVRSAWTTGILPVAMALTVMALAAIAAGAVVTPVALVLGMVPAIVVMVAVMALAAMAATDLATAMETQETPVTAAAIQADQDQELVMAGRTTDRAVLPETVGADPETVSKQKTRASNP